MIWVDSNIFLETELKQGRFNECTVFLKSICAQKKAVTSDYVLYSVILLMERNKCSVESIKTFIGMIFGLKHLTIYRPSLSDMSNALRISKEFKTDFDDSLVYACMQSLKINKIATLDKDFKKFKELEIVEL